MKKLTNILLAGTTAIVLSACGSSGSSSISKVDISELYKGYSISGTYASSDAATFEYCNNEVTLIAEGTQVGTFELDVETVNMYLSTDRFLVAEIIGEGVYELSVNGTYDTLGQGDFTITDISTIPCELLPS